jgi:hypothetical protein
MSLFSYEVDSEGIATRKYESYEICGENMACDESYIYIPTNPWYPIAHQGDLQILSADIDGVITLVEVMPSEWNTLYKVFKLGDFLYAINYYEHDQMREERIYRYSIAPDGVLTMLDYVDSSAWGAAGPIVDMCINNEGRIFVSLGGTSSLF